MARTGLNVVTSRQDVCYELPAHRRSLLPVVGAACLVTSVATISFARDDQVTSRNGF
jgi:hypothetical protein